MFCPYCKTKKEMNKAGFAYGGDGKLHQRYECVSKPCRRTTIHPLKSK